MENYTKNGLMFIIIGIIISMITSFLLGLYQFFVPTENVAAILGYVGFGMIGSIGGLLTLVGAILFFVGRKEFGEKHQQFVIYAAVTIVIGIVITTFFSIIGALLFNSMIYTIPAITVIGAVTGGLGYVFALFELESDTGKKLLYTALFVSIVISVLIGFLNAGQIGELIENYPAENSMNAFSYLSNVSIYSTLGIISSLFWLTAVYLAYKRIKDGELVPKNINLFDKRETISERHCPNCAKIIPEDAKICPYCGKRFENQL
jgi:MFS family permease